MSDINKGPALRRSIIRDPVSPSDYLNLNLIYACEHCSFFEEENQTCNLGLLTKPHLKSNQEKKFEMSGTMSFCRFLEID